MSGGQRNKRETDQKHQLLVEIPNTRSISVDLVAQFVCTCVHVYVCVCVCVCTRALAGVRMYVTRLKLEHDCVTANLAEMPRHMSSPDGL